MGLLHKNKADILNEAKEVRAAQKNPDHFKKLYDRYYKHIFLFVFRRTADEHLTADLTSQVFLKALINIKKYKFKGVPFSAWLYRIASNEVNMHYRKRKKEQVIDIDETVITDIIEEAEEANTQNNQELMIAALNELPEDQTDMIDLRFFEKLSYREIGNIYGITEDNAKVRIYRTLKKLKKIVTLMRKKRND